MTSSEFAVLQIYKYVELCRFCFMFGAFLNRLCFYNWQIQKGYCTDLPIESHSQEVGQRILKGNRASAQRSTKSKACQVGKGISWYQGNSAYIIVILNSSLLMPILQPFSNSYVPVTYISTSWLSLYSQQLAGVLRGVKVMSRLQWILGVLSW